jgi:GNAT superfamily N-acetyltransferase
MLDGDLDRVVELGDRVHVNYPEAADVFVEKQRLFPQGCFTLDADHKLVGYCVSHPWVQGRPPPLDAYLGTLPVTPTTYYLHDIVVAPELRGQGLARRLIPVLRCVTRLHQLASITLVSVNATTKYWHSLGWRDVDSADLQRYVRDAYSDEAVMMVAPVDRFFET